MGCTVLQMLTGSNDFYGVSSPVAILYHVGSGNLVPKVLDSST